MTCNAIATAVASVNLNDNVTKLLDLGTVSGKALIEAIMLKALASMGIQAKTANSVDAAVFAYGLAVSVTKYGVSVRADSYCPQIGQRTEIAQTVGKFMTTAAGIMLQQKIKAVVAARGTVTGEQRAADGSLILNVEF